MLFHMSLMDEKQKMWKEAEERAKAMKAKEEAVYKAAQAFDKVKEPEDIEAARKGMDKAYQDYGDEYKKPSIFKRFLQVLGL